MLGKKAEKANGMNAAKGHSGPISTLQGTGGAAAKF